MEKKTVCEIVVWVTGGLGQKPDWKKWPGVSDSDTVTGELSDLVTNQQTHVLQWGNMVFLLVINGHSFGT